MSKFYYQCIERQSIVGVFMTEKRDQFTLVIGSHYCHEGSVEIPISKQKAQQIERFLLQQDDDFRAWNCTKGPRPKCYYTRDWDSCDQCGLPYERK